MTLTDEEVERRDATGARRLEAVWLTCGMVAAVLLVGLVVLRVGGGGAAAGAPVLRFTGGYVPEPASPDVAAAYVVIHDDGDTPDQLLRVSTSAAATATLHEETAQGAAERMIPIPSLTVPAHGSVTLTPGGAHIMLVRPEKLTPGATVRLTLVFARTGTVTLALPVRGLFAGPAPSDATDQPAS